MAQSFAKFFKLATVGKLKDFFNDLDHSQPEQAAMAYYMQTWPIWNANDDCEISPSMLLSGDVSAIMYGSVPVIFAGSNNWCLKPYFSMHSLIEKLDDLVGLILVARNLNRHAQMTVILVPEKDYVISRFLLMESRFDNFYAAVSYFKMKLKSIDVDLIFEEPFRDLVKFQGLADFEYMDSHLAGRNYVTIFGFALQSLGLSWPVVERNIRLRLLPEFGDLAAKFSDTRPTAMLRPQPEVSGAKVVQVAGAETFCEPLADTWQEFRNDAPVIDPRKRRLFWP